MEFEHLARSFSALFTHQVVRRLRNGAGRLVIGGLIQNT